MRHLEQRGTAAAAIALVLITSGCYGSGDAGGVRGVRGASAQRLITMTPAGKGKVDRITWALYRGVTSVDPILTGDYPENTVTTQMCESLFRQSPEGTIQPGLATKLEYPDPKTAVLTLRGGVTFWDGSPMTAEDAAFSVERNRDVKYGGFWSPFLTRVASIRATGPLQVTIKLKQPDYWLRNILSFMPGMVISKKYAMAKAKEYGTVKGGAMCTGPYRLSRWRTGDVLSVVRNDRYWNPSELPLVRQIDFKGIPDEATLTAALQTGEVDGAYAELPLSTLDQLRTGGKVKVYQGPSYLIDAFIGAHLDKGPLADVRVRRALSLAVDREGYLRTLYKGTAQPARALGAPGAWGEQRAAFQAAWDALPDPKVDLETARRLVQEAGATGQTITFGMTNELNKIATEANLLKTAAEKIGLKARFKAVSTDGYMNFFMDPKIRAGVDGFFTTNYPNWADPGALYATMVHGGVQDYGGYRDPKAGSLLDRARGTEDPVQRTRLTVEAQKVITDDLPWIPLVAPNTVLILNSRLTGAPVTSQYLFAPWAGRLGEVG